MENKQQTAVSWLIDSIVTHQLNPREIPETIIAQAKAMEKKQIVKAYEQGKYDGDSDTYTEFTFAEQYYDETYEK